MPTTIADATLDRTTTMTNTLSHYTDDAPALRVMHHDASGNGTDAGSALDVFAGRLGLIEVGSDQGEDAQRGAYNWWPLTIDERNVGELRDDANGLTIHVTA